MSATTSGYKSGPKPNRPRSVVWNYFEKITEEPYVAICKLCHARCSHANNTSNLFKHLRVKHPVSFREAERQRNQDMELYCQLQAKAGKIVTRPMKPLTPLTPPVKKPRGRGRPRYSVGVESLSSGSYATNVKAETGDNSTTPSMEYGTRRHVFTPGGKQPREYQSPAQAFLSMLARDMEHPSIVNRPGFRDFVASMDHRYTLPTTKTIANNLIPELVEKTRHKLKLEIVAALYFTLSVETWHYKSTQMFTTVSAHFIKESWEMCSVVLESFDCSEGRTEDTIATNLKRITDEWGITDQVVTLLLDSPDNIMSSASLLNGWDELMCFGYMMNQIVLNSLASEPDIVRIQKKAQDAVTYFDLHIKASDTLTAVQQQHSLPCHKLKSEHSPFWTSTLAMFERIVEQYEAVNTVLCFLGHDLMCLCDDEVDLIRVVLMVLNPFQAATKELCSEPFTLMSKLIPIATVLQQVLDQGVTSPISASESTSPVELALRNALQEQMQQHLSAVENNYRLAVATLLDPRFKQHAFTDQTALEEAQQRLLCDVQAIVQNSNSGLNGDLDPVANTGSDGASFWGLFDKKVVEAGAIKTDLSEAENETRRFFKEANISRTADPLQWWKINGIQFPHLKVLAKKFLCVPATAIPSSRVFSKEGNEFCRRRDLFRPGQLNNMLFLNKNLSL